MLGDVVVHVLNEFPFGAHLRNQIQDFGQHHDPYFLCYQLSHNKLQPGLNLILVHTQLPSSRVGGHELSEEGD